MRNRLLDISNHK